MESAQVGNKTPPGAGIRKPEIQFCRKPEPEIEFRQKQTSGNRSPEIRKSGPGPNPKLHCGVFLCAVQPSGPRPWAQLPKYIAVHSYGWCNPKGPGPWAQPSSISWCIPVEGVTLRARGPALKHSAVYSCGWCNPKGPAQALGGNTQVRRIVLLWAQT